MVALKGYTIDQSLKSLDKNIRVYCVYGPDTGLISERVENIARQLLKGNDDPFALVQLGGDDIASDSNRLLDEALTMSLLGGKRVIKIRLSGKNIASSIEVLLKEPRIEATVVIDAGDLKKGAPLRNLCEKEEKAWAIPCYADGVKDIERVIHEELAEAKLTATPEAMALLKLQLGSDRLLTRAELEKLCLYAAGQRTIQADDVRAAITDTSPESLDDVIDSAFLGQRTKLLEALKRASKNNLPSPAILASAMRHAQYLHRSLDNGTFGAEIMWHRKEKVEQQRHIWTRESELADVVLMLDETTWLSRKAYALADEIITMALLRIAQKAAQARG
jgi:DNA polymerase III subunit delta